MHFETHRYVEIIPKLNFDVFHQKTPEFHSKIYFHVFWIFLAVTILILWPSFTIFDHSGHFWHFLANFGQFDHFESNFWLFLICISRIRKFSEFSLNMKNIFFDLNLKIQILRIQPTYKNFFKFNLHMKIL